MREGCPTPSKSNEDSFLALVLNPAQRAGVGRPRAKCRSNFRRSIVHYHSRAQWRVSEVLKEDACGVLKISMKLLFPTTGAILTASFKKGDEISSWMVSVCLSQEALKPHLELYESTLPPLRSDHIIILSFCYSLCLAIIRPSFCYPLIIMGISEFYSV
jgi:hypothetical protein